MIKFFNSKYSIITSFITSCAACGTIIPTGLNCPHCRGFKYLSKSNLKKANISKRFYSKAISGIEKKSDANVNSTSLKLVGETKHYPPANKEWTNSVYTYNKASLRSLSVKDNMAKKLIKSYFNLHIEKNIARSKRMRSLIRKSTTKKLFVSRPEIKQTNDRVIVTVYTFDRERQFLFRKLYFRISRWERFKKVNRRIEVKLKSKKRGLKKKSSKRKFINKKVFKAKYFSKYDQWRLKNQLFIKPFTQNVRKTPLNKIFDKSDILPYSEARRLAILGVYAPHIFKKPIKAKLLKDKSFRTHALLEGYNKLVTFKTKKNKPIHYLSKPGSKNINSVIKRRKNLSKTSYKKINSVIKRRKNFYPKQIFYKLKPWLKTTSMLKSFKRLLKKRSLMFIKRRLKVIRKKLPYFGFKHSNQISFFNYKVNNKRLLDAKKMLLYFYIASALSLFKIKMLSFEDILKVNEKKIKKLKKEDYDLLYRQNKNKKAFTSKKDKNILIKRKVPFYLRRFQKYKVPFNLGKYGSVVFYHKKNKYSISLKNLSFDSFVKILLSLLNKISLTFNLKQMAASHFKNFSSKFFLQVFYKSLFYAKNKKKLEKNLKKFNKDVLTINSLVKLAINQSKFGKFLPSLKLLISKIYNKKTELNIVNLKSPHLNTDIFTEAVAVKLKKRVGLLRVMRRSLQLVKLPSRFKRASEQFNVNDLGILNKFKFLNLNNLKNNLKGLNYSDSLQTILTSIYPRSLTFKPLTVYGLNGLYILNSKNKRYYSKLNKLSGVLNQIKYKWTTGVRLEAAGRLTRRYTASRSVFKFRQKGSLQNTDYSRKLDFLGNSMPNIMLRNLAKSNSQHTFLNSKKRIGAFGLNTLMSSY